MHANRAARRSLWRWRRSPLRRRVDVVEAWILVLVWLVVAVGGPLAGVLSADATVDALAERRAQRHPVTAALVRDAPRDSAVGATVGDRVFATVRWTAADGTRHTGKALVDGDRRAGDRVVVWTDRQDRITPEPQTPAQAELEAAFMGTASAIAVTGVAAAAFRAARVVLDRCRGRAWDAEWREAGSRWGRTAG
ncbi:hypothetical protein ACIF8T_22245 [Streptomyces sp. NPDC085946]|uniref:Rv1733c family protein n=1 Tax=Streptomyces sp. NPDC085946 TaxID=3365744 RepID=UPI0037D588AA